MPNPTENDSTSSADSERLTMAYTESVVGAEDVTQEVSDDSSLGFFTSSSSSLETPTSQESFTSQFAALDRMLEMQSHFGYEPVWRTMSTSEGPKLRTLEYFRAQSVFQLFSFLMSHLLADTPEDPVLFLMSLVDRCIHYRDHDDEPPLLFLSSHVDSVYTALDPVCDGSITFSQYLAGMNTLGLTEFNLLPNEGESDDRSIAKDVFLAEAREALLNQLDQMLGKLTVRSTIMSQEQTSVPSVKIEEYASQTTKDKVSVASDKKQRSIDKTYIVP